MNNAAMNIHVQLLCEHRLSIFLGVYLRVELLGCIVILFNFLRICQPVSKAMASLSFTLAVSEGSSFSAFSVILATACPHRSGHPSKYLVVIQICRSVSLKTNETASFLVLIGYLYILFGELFIHILCPLLIVFLLLSCKSSWCILHMSPLSDL